MTSEAFCFFIMPTQSVDLNIESDVLTAGATAEVVNAILEFLLYQRNQIPLVYETYKYYINKWSIDDGNKQSEEVHEVAFMQNFQLQKQREQAKRTKNSIGAMRELVCESFQKVAIKSLRFLFGATTFTPKEAYTIHIPTEAISHNHCHDHHRLSRAHLNQILLSLLTNKDLHVIFSNNLCSTNLYLELEVLESPTTARCVSKSAKLFPKEPSRLPPSCKDVHLHLLHSHRRDLDNRSLQCCKELQVFEDVVNSVELSEEEIVADEERLSIDGVKAAWWEAETIVRGFKEKPLKGLNMWTH